MDGDINLDCLTENKVVNLFFTVIQDNDGLLYNANFDTNNNQFVLWSNNQYKWFDIEEIKSFINNKTLHIICDKLNIFNKFLAKPSKIKL